MLNNITVRSLVSLKTVVREKCSILSNQGITHYIVIQLVFILLYRVYLEFERPRSSRSSSQSNNVLDAVYIALKKKYVIM